MVKSYLPSVKAKKKKILDLQVGELFGEEGLMSTDNENLVCNSAICASVDGTSLQVVRYSDILRFFKRIIPEI